jgi:AcrR family transcriptional regulator
MDVRAEDRPSAAERWRDIRRNNLLDAASRIFARQGYEDASVEEIAFAAGIGKPTVYRYFPSKEALFEAAFGYALDDLESRLDAALALPGTFEQRLVHLVTEIVPTIRTHFGSISPMGESETSKRRLFRQRRTRVEARLKAAIEDGQAGGEARPFDSAIAAKLMVGMVRSGVTADHLSDTQIAEAVVGLALHGLGAPAPEAVS